MSCTNSEINVSLLSKKIQPLILAIVLLGATLIVGYYLNYEEGPEYRIMWNPVIPKAVIEKYNYISEDWSEVRTFRDLDEADRQLDRILFYRKESDKVDSQWKVVREEL